MPREEAVGDAVIGQRDGREHHGRHERMDQVHEPHPEPLVLGHVHPQAGLEDREAPRGDEPVVDLPVRAAEAVGEVEEEAGEGAEAEQRLDHQRAHRGARAVAGSGGEQQLEGEKGAGGEEVDEHGGLGEGFLHASCDCPLPTTAACRRRRR